MLLTSPLIKNKKKKLIKNWHTCRMHLHLALLVTSLGALSAAGYLTSTMGTWCYHCHVCGPL